MGRTGLVVELGQTDDEAAEAARERIVRYQREYAGVFFVSDGEPLFDHPEVLDRQSERARRAAAVGSATSLVQRLLDLQLAGVDTFVLNVRFDFPDDQHPATMTAFAEIVLPTVRKAWPAEAVASGGSAAPSGPRRQGGGRSAAA